MPLNNLLGHSEQYRTLLDEVARRPSHAYLFSGPAGVGKRLVAEAVTHALMCQRAPGPEFCCTPDNCPVRARSGAARQDLNAKNTRCECCAECVQVAAKVHPDFIAVFRAAVRTEVLIEQARDLIARLAIKPARGPLKVAIVDDADTLSLPAQNALLKTLEEPPGYAIIFLIAAGERLLLDTVRSRLRPVRFGPLGNSDICELLIRSTGLDRSRAAALAPLSRGSAARALKLAEGDEPPILELVRALKGAPQLDFLAVRTLAESFFRDREQASENFELLARLLEEVLVRKLLGAELSTSAAAVAAGIRELCDTFSVNAILVSLSGALEASSAIDLMANPRLQAEQWWLGVGRALRGD